MESESVSRSFMSDSCNPRIVVLSGSSVRGILQARILEWVAVTFSGESSRNRDLTQVLQGDSLHLDTREGAHELGT